MEKRRDGWYRADKGKHFVLTELGKKECASYRSKTVGEPVDEYDYEAVHWAVEEGYVAEVDIPDWITKEGYEVVYDHKGYTLHAGNPVVFPEREIAEKYLQYYQNKLWNDRQLYIRSAIYEGRAIKECREYNGKKVYNDSWYYGTSSLSIGDLVEESIVEDIVNALPPACWRSDCTQLGEPASQRVDEEGNVRTTYETFKKIAENTWEYCGDCFRGETEQNYKKYGDMSNTEIRKITYEECPIKCTGCEALCDEMSVGQCRKNLSYKLDNRR